MAQKNMFCYQCEQTAKGEGCNKSGVCGKDPEVSALQDVLVYALKGLSAVAVDARKAGIVDHAVDVFTVKALFSTLTNVDFDAARFVELIGQCTSLRDALKDQAKKRLITPLFSRMIGRGWCINLVNTTPQIQHRPFSGLCR